MKEVFETVVGLEIHVQLNTQSKAFCRDANHFGDQANTNVGAISLGLPGTLPSVNRGQVLSAIKLGVALGCTIDKASHFDRKHYTYPDLTKGYQITQDDKPICLGGSFTFKSENKEKTISLHHIHMEEDAGKSIHDISDDVTCLDYNRAGAPLLEVVTEPDFRSAQEVSDFIGAFQNLVRYLEISDANMEEGSLRCDCNISVREHAQDPYGTRTEIKNVNSKKFAKQAIRFEAKRQWDIIKDGGQIVQESRLFDAAKGETFSMRKKEDALDYRYFPEPDLQSIVLTDQLIQNIHDSIDMIPSSAKLNLTSEHGLNESLADTICSEKSLVYLFHQMNAKVNNGKLVANFIANQFVSVKNEIETEQFESKISAFVTMLQLINSDKLSASTAYTILIPIIIDSSDINIEKTAIELNIFQEENGTDIQEICQGIIDEYPQKAMAFKKGKKGLLGFFMGQFMKTGDKSKNPKDIQKVFEKLLNS